MFKAITNLFINKKKEPKTKLIRETWEESYNEETYDDYEFREEPYDYSEDDDEYDYEDDDDEYDYEDGDDIDKEIEEYRRYLKDL